MSSLRNVEFWLEATSHIESEMAKGSPTIDADTTFYNEKVDKAVEQLYKEFVDKINETLKVEGIDEAQEIINGARQGLTDLLSSHLV